MSGHSILTDHLTNAANAIHLSVGIGKGKATDVFTYLVLTKASPSQAQIQGWGDNLHLCMEKAAESHRSLRAQEGR